jgi:hypothetical protein|tara:strand:- start:926 stop:1303 length:378 start_codon:yes stop_codon:yes gene_type:complete
MFPPRLAVTAVEEGAIPSADAHFKYVPDSHCSHLAAEAAVGGTRAPGEDGRVLRESEERPARLAAMAVLERVDAALQQNHALRARGHRTRWLKALTYFFEKTITPITIRPLPPLEKFETSSEWGS